MYKKHTIPALTVSLSSFLLGINLTILNTAKEIFSVCSAQHTTIKSCINTTTSQWAFLIALLSLGAPITALFHNTLFKHFYSLISRYIENKNIPSLAIKNNTRDINTTTRDINTTTTPTNTTPTNTTPTTLHILLLANILYLSSTVIFICCVSYTLLCISRILTGMAVGLTSLSVPSFLSVSNRFIKNYHQIFIILGIFCGQIFSFIFNALETWKYPFYILFMIIFLHTFLLYFKRIEIIEYYNGYIGDSSKRGSKGVDYTSTDKSVSNPSLTLDRSINTEPNPSLTLDTCINTEPNPSLTLDTCINNSMIINNNRNTLVISLLTHVLQQLSCINGVIQYTSLLISNNIPYTLLIITINITMLIFTLISITIKMERKRLFLISNVLTLVGLIMLSSSLNVLFSLFVYLIGFTIGLGPIPWQLVGGSKEKGVEGVNSMCSEQQGVNDRIEDYDSIKGVNYKSSEQQGVNYMCNEQQGVNDSIKGVNYKSSEQQGVISPTIEQHPFNNTTNTLHPFNNNIYNQHPFNTSVKRYSNTFIAKTCVTVNWLTCFIFSYIFPITHNYMDKRCYLLYAFICSVIYMYIYVKGDNVI